MKLYGRCSRRRFLSFWLVVTLVYVFYVEYCVYMWNSTTWHKLNCENERDCTKILLVADPQIIGQRKEIIHFLTPFAILDSDLYLKNTYYWAFRFAQPDIVIFLGDLMDEGSIAKNAEFYSYVRRVFNIFNEHAPPTVKHIWLPGDNDIGGEEFDRVTEEKFKRFHRAFAQPELINHKNITFFKINRFIQSIPVIKEKRDFYDTSKIFVGLSHVPLMFIPSLFVEKVFNKVLPQVLFTAHEHKSMIVSTDALLRQDRQIVPVTPDNNKVYEFTLGNTDMYEFIIPTCSYRMGTDKIGYGFAVLEKNELRYTVLWSPSRFRQLYNYALVLCFIFLNFVFYFCCCRKSAKRFF
ncbi:uncharacterized protein Mppe [Tribolium castaneum]|uniref:uncharacterized protein Mppe n=1 Tax=Tribolium castaneum TaxID=7070 RepID=UPI00046BF4A6|nr:PREDICTED: uncharacterized protein LOC663285 [Tribolium castaneum]XP_008190944.1 PREDICTED: uncharacterized protein LOC663285 [Tribolium castaneum]|eukprot:XP_008190943.1 PREDICTED: uncharacterized protein LOC663285 [Tribolium castaneum]